MTIQKAVMERRSVRTYDNSKFTDDTSRQIDDILRRLPKKHIGNSMVSVKRVDFPEGTKVAGTYGSISGARHYLVIYSSSSVGVATLIDCGLIAELVAIYATRDGLGTCLMTDTVRDVQFAEAAGLGGADYLLLVTPIGLAADKRSLTEKITRKLSGSTKRRPLSKWVFTDDDMTTPWTPGPDDKLLQAALEAMGRAPSAYNRQPWRVVVKPSCIEVHNADSTSSSWIGIGTAMTNYCAIVGIRGESLEISGPADNPVIVAPRPVEI